MEPPLRGDASVSSRMSRPRGPAAHKRPWRKALIDRRLSMSVSFSVELRRYRQRGGGRGQIGCVSHPLPYHRPVHPWRGCSPGRLLSFWVGRGRSSSENGPSHARRRRGCPGRHSHAEMPVLRFAWSGYACWWWIQGRAWREGRRCREGTQAQVRPPMVS